MQNHLIEVVKIQIRFFVKCFFSALIQHRKSAACFFLSILWLDLFTILIFRFFIFFDNSELLIVGIPCHNIEHLICSTVNIVNSESIHFSPSIDSFTSAHPLLVRILSFDKVFDIVQTFQINVECVLSIDFLKASLSCKCPYLIQGQLNCFLNCGHDPGSSATHLTVDCLAPARNQRNICLAALSHLVAHLWSLLLYWISYLVRIYLNSPWILRFCGACLIAFCHVEVMSRIFKIIKFPQN